MVWWLILSWSPVSRCESFSGHVVRAQQLWPAGSISLAQELWHSGCTACGISLDRGLNTCTQHYKANILATRPPGKPPRLDSFHSNMPLRFFHVFSWFHFFSGLNDILFSKCTTVYLSIHLPKDIFLAFKF